MTLSADQLLTLVMWMAKGAGAERLACVYVCGGCGGLGGGGELLRQAAASAAAAAAAAAARAQQQPCEVMSWMTGLGWPHRRDARPCASASVPLRLGCYLMRLVRGCVRDRPRRVGPLPPSALPCDQQCASHGFREVGMLAYDLLPNCLLLHGGPVCPYGRKARQFIQ